MRVRYIEYTLNFRIDGIIKAMYNISKIYQGQG
jgi:hypothetical protein